MLNPDNRERRAASGVLARTHLRGSRLHILEHARAISVALVVSDALVTGSVVYP
jgi:hypothetical protein